MDSLASLAQRKRDLAAEFRRTATVISFVLDRKACLERAEQLEREAAELERKAPGLKPHGRPDAG